MEVTEISLGSAVFVAYNRDGKQNTQDDYSDNLLSASNNHASPIWNFSVK